MAGLIVVATIAALKKAGVFDALVSSFTILVKSVGTVVMSAIKSLVAEINLASKKAQTKSPKPQKEKHHIIPKKKSEAKAAYDVWTGNCKLNINDSRNLVSISYNLHKPLHTNAYCAAINSLVVTAYKKNKDRGVINAVIFVKCLLTVASYNIK